jgi:PAS domain S-box-containing protein
MQAENPEGIQKLRNRIATLERELAAARNSAEANALRAAPVAIWIAHDAQCKLITGNSWADDVIMRTPRGGNVSRSAAPGEAAISYRVLRDGAELIPEELPAQKAAGTGQTVINEQLELLFPDGRRVSLLTSAAPLVDARGDVRGAVAAGVDVTASRQAEEALHEQYRRLCLHIDNSPLAIIEWDSHFRITRWAGTAERVFGWTTEEVLGKHIYELPWIHPDDLPLIGQVMDDMLSGRRPSNLNQNRNVRKDGSVIHCEWYNSSIRDASGRLISVLSEVLDVTDRKQTEDALRDSQTQFRSLADSIPQLAWMADETGWIFWYNQRWYDYTGTTLEEMQGWGWQKVHHPAHVERVVERIKRCFESGVVWEDTFPLRGKDGQYRWFLSRALPVRDSAGRTVRWFGTNTDITAQKEAEAALRATQEQFRRLYEANVVGIISADGEKIYEANDVFLNMIGYDREDLNAGRLRWKDLTPPEYARVDEIAIQELLGTGCCKPLEKEYIRKVGGHVPVLIGATLIERSPFRCFAFVIDLTERKALEKKLAENHKFESIGMLAGGIAHDFNNLLVGILGNASLAQDLTPPGSTMEQLLRDIVASGERAAHLTRQMLAYSGKGRFLMEPIDLSREVEEVVRLVQSSISRKIGIHLEAGRSLPPIEADRGQIQQVIMNLLLNAAEAVGDEVGIVSIRTGVQAVDAKFIREALEHAEIEPGTYVALEVRDSGCGMDAQTKAKIFDPFFTTKFTGRGLGLAAVAGVVRGHQGAVEVVSAPGEGSTFRVLFPAAARVRRPAAEAPAAQERNAAGTVLIVDDEEVVLRTAKAALERSGYTVLTASSGWEAIDVCYRAPDISAVVLDFSMPQMSGQDVLPRLRDIRRDLTVIISSGYSEEEALRLFAGQQVSGFLQKPYTAAALAEKVAAVIQGHHSKDGANAASDRGAH